MLKKIKNYVLKNKLISLFNIVVILIFLFPYSYNYCRNWNTNYILSGIELSFFYSFLVLETILFQLNFNKKLKDFFLISLLILCGIYFMAILFSMKGESDLFIFGPSSYLALLLFPIMLLITYSRFQSKH
ncbi:hypothetical protein GGR31_002794 [Mesonia maritima]|uniref:Uncharacterized protein n=1 Tax=Mesonia maritima TaxID=1793873 RepID=A0ABU1K945_9FLAO|nr:hypothetical protein [Mesonia maritima]